MQGNLTPFREAGLKSRPGIAAGARLRELLKRSAINERVRAVGRTASQACGPERLRVAPGDRLMSFPSSPFPRPVPGAPPRPDHTTLQLEIPEDAWQNNQAVGGDEHDPAPPGSRLYASVSLGGVPFHCDALEVTRNAKGELEASHYLWEWSLAGYLEAAAVTSPLRTMTIRDRQYAVFLTAFEVA